MLTNTNDWERCDKSGLVSIGSYSLFASTSGPPRRPHAPVVIFITGGGAPTEFYVHLQDAISKFARTYFFDRAGYGRSERPTSDRNSRCGCPKEEVVDGAANKPRGVWWPLGSLANSDINGTQDCRSISAEDSAFELHRLMEAIDVQPPYVLAAHSYGGIIARTYYGLFPNHIAGMALLDTNSELLQQCLSPMPPPAFKKVTSDVDPEEVLHLREASGMSDEEWEAAMAAIVRTIPASTSEATFSSGRDLARRMQIDRQAILETLFNEGVRLGGGTAQERREAEQWIESAELYCAQVQRVQLELSSNARYVFFDDVGHDFPIRFPQRTAEVVKRLLAM